VHVSTYRERSPKASEHSDRDRPRLWILARKNHDLRDWSFSFTSDVTFRVQSRNSSLFSVSAAHCIASVPCTAAPGVTTLNPDVEAGVRRMRGGVGLRINRAGSRRQTSRRVRHKSLCYESVSRTASFWTVNLRRTDASSDIGSDIIMKTRLPTCTCARHC
jgi:hypothetical protein